MLGPVSLRPSQVPVTHAGDARDVEASDQSGGLALASLSTALPWSRPLAGSLSEVRLHPESGQIAGSTHALTMGSDVHFAPARFAPGTEHGDRLIAHELAHVLQQRQTGPPAPELAAELDADAMAAVAVRGHRPQPRAAVAAGEPRAYEAWEHRQLGDAYGGADRRIRLPNGVELSYGQIVALSGDFYRSPEALLRAPRAELEDILRVMAREQALASASPTHAPSSADANALNASYELATTGHSRSAGSVPALAGDANTASGVHGEVREGEHVESGAPGADSGFFDLAASNPAHFSPENIALNWRPKHQLALDLARQAWQQRNPGRSPAAMAPGSHASARTGSAAPGAATAAGLAPTAATAATIASGRPDPAATRTPAATASAQTTASSAEQREAEAWLASSFSDHFLTDAFAAGHLISGSAGRSLCQTFFTTHETAITVACWACATADGMAPELAAGVVPALRRFLASRAASLLLKTVHDYYNRSGLEVRNALGQVWRTVGDAHLGGSPETVAMGGLASKASRDAVQDVLATGGTNRADAALDYIPDMARLPSGTFEPVATFTVNPLVWNPVLARALTPAPATNDLYQLVKGNIRPMGELWARQQARSARSSASGVARDASGVVGRATDWVREQAHEVEAVPGRVERDIERIYGVPR
jgi:hypothetical protein